MKKNQEPAKGDKMRLSSTAIKSITRGKRVSNWENDKMGRTRKEGGGEKERKERKELVLQDHGDNFEQTFEAISTTH